MGRWPSNCLVRCLFDTSDDLHKHLRLGEGFFLPGVAITGASGAPVIVEIGFNASRDRAVIHGRLGRTAGDGVWLVAPSIHKISRWAPGSPRRRYRRLGCALFAEVRPRYGAPWLCRTMDLSPGGVRLATGSFEAGIAGDEVRLTLIAPDAELKPVDARARLAWAGARQAGLIFQDRSKDLGVLIGAVAGQWSDVPEIRHGAVCACTRTPARRAAS